MYKIKESGKGKLYCSVKGAFALNNDLSQRVLKQLFNDNCEHIQYEPTTKSEETKSKESTAKTDTSNGTSRRKANRRKANKERKDN